MSSSVNVGFNSAVTSIASFNVPDLFGLRSAINALSKCKWLSTKPGIKTRPSASMTSLASPVITGAISMILPSLIATSCNASPS